MKIAVIIARILLGLPFVVFGLNHFLEFMPEPEMDGVPLQLMEAFAATGYMWPLIKVTEIACGVLLIVGRFVPLALVLITPVVVNIVLFHAFLAPAEIPMALVLTALEAFLVWRHWASFRGILTA